jgi:DNA-directed RNA polymerase II subunit RPB1
MHVPQSYETTAELKHIAHVPKQIIAPKSNSPVMGIVQDSLLGIYLFTMRDTFLTRE